MTLKKEVIYHVRDDAIEIEILLFQTASNTRRLLDVVHKICDQSSGYVWSVHGNDVPAFFNHRYLCVTFDSLDNFSPRYVTDLQMVLKRT